MKNCFRLTLFLATLGSVGSPCLADNLFSEVAMESVFEQKATPAPLEATQTNGEALERITGVSSLTQALKLAGFSPKANAERVSIQVPHAGWNFPTDLQVQIENDRIGIEMALLVLSDTQPINSKDLLSLMEKNDGVSGQFFAYEPSRKLIVLRTAMENRALSTKKIQTQLTQLAAFGEKHSNLWTRLKPNSKEDSKKSANATAASASNSSPPAGTFSLVGNWGAALNDKDSIAIQIKDDMTFKLVTVQAGKSNISSGKYVRQGTHLSLNGDDGVNLQCTVTQSVANQFQLFVQDEKGNAKLKVDFQKAN